MCADWLRRGDPIRCEMTGFKPGREHVVLCFYRDEEKRLSYRESAIAKLTSYTSEYKQDNIQNLKPGEKLTCSEDDYTDDKVNVLDWCSEPIGRLSKNTPIDSLMKVLLVFSSTMPTKTPMVA